MNCVLVDEDIAKYVDSVVSRTHTSISWSPAHSGGQHANVMVDFVSFEYV